MLLLFFAAIRTNIILVKKIHPLNLQYALVESYKNEFQSFRLLGPNFVFRQYIPKKR